ncbi:hypothetical protein L596_016620 [Steinernema carpocapsae]|uniref:Uncharacterized protein n=1 Tax=Steinernema carpocapsae TaxID=34508 RepID=A0A4U5NJK9_STECR|nr:hypothetical protein L596_016620 [Steinernema carpocapsae]
MFAARCAGLPEFLLKSDVTIATNYETESRVQHALLGPTFAERNTINHKRKETIQNSRGPNQQPKTRIQRIQASALWRIYAQRPSTHIINVDVLIYCDKGFKFQI